MCWSDTAADLTGSYWGLATHWVATEWVDSAVWGPS